MDILDNVTTTFDFYKDVYNGKKKEEDIDLGTAALEVYLATFSRAKKGRLTPFQMQMVQLAICAQADYNASTIDTPEIGDNVASYEIGDVKISFDSNSATAITSQYAICKKARKYLLPTNLLNRVVG